MTEICLGGECEVLWRIWRTFYISETIRHRKMGLSLTDSSFIQFFSEICLNDESDAFWQIWRMFCNSETTKRRQMNILPIDSLTS